MNCGSHYSPKQGYVYLNERVRVRVRMQVRKRERDPIQTFTPKMFRLGLGPRLGA